MGHLLGYARVSTSEQDPALQDHALRNAGYAKVWTDVASGARDDRAELAKVLRAAAAGRTSWSSGGWIVSHGPCVI